ncbi:MAG: LemA family protein [Eubacteriales bacterium]
MGFAIGIGAVAIVIIIWVIGAYNGFIKMRNMVEEAFATMDVYLKKRYDLIPNIVETVKGYAKHEAQTLEKVIAARNMAANATTTEAKVAGENALQGTLKSLFAIAEAYPDLKANASFINLQTQLTDMEGEIANARKYYNAIVKTFNTKVEVFPSNIIAKLFKFTRKTMFEVEEADQRQNVKVSF